MSYRAPLVEFSFLFDHVIGFQRLTKTERFQSVTPDIVSAILTEAAKLSEEVLAPLQRPGDKHPARLENGVVVTSPGFAAGYRAIADGGWTAMTASPDFGGMGLPMTVTTAVNEMMSSACLSLQLNPLMTQGQIEALEHHASDSLRAAYIPKLVSGEWCGTMNLTEPQAGSDVGSLSTRAAPNDDGSFAITGQKIFISWADNDFTSNVCHLVLARLQGRPAGTRGISLFLVPKLIPDATGNPGKRNTLSVVSLEHKMGLHGSPTAVMHFDGATGWMVGEPDMGLRAMFTMMNNARLGVGVQGIGVAEAALQHALSFALSRKQGQPLVQQTGMIADHADVRRMLATMQAEVFTARAIALSCAMAIDMGRATGDPDWLARAAFLTPIAKAFGTETGIDVASMGIQVHGGTGYIEQSGAAQFLRDVRVTAIYEGTNGIQAMDLVGRKLADGGDAAFRLLEEIQTGAENARADLPDLAGDVWNAVENMREATEWLLTQPINDRNACAVPYLHAFARILGGHFHLKSARVDTARLPLARFAIRRLLPESLLQKLRGGADELFSIPMKDPWS